MQRATLAVALTSALVAAATPPTLSLSSTGSGGYALLLDGEAWYASAPGSVCVHGRTEALVFSSSAPASGTDALGPWAGTALSFASAASGAPVTLTLRSWTAHVGAAAATITFPAGIDTSGCSGAGALATALPAWNTSAVAAPTLGALTWTGEALSSTIVAAGLGVLGLKGLDTGPIISFKRSPNPVATPALAWSTLDAHKIITQSVAPPAGRGATYAMGLTSAVPAIPANWSHSILYSAAYGGPTAVTYAHGMIMQAYYNTTRLPSVTLTDIGYYTGACEGGRADAS